MLHQCGGFRCPHWASACRFFRHQPSFAALPQTLRRRNKVDLLCDNESKCLVTELANLLRQIIKLLALSPADYGH
jgi:hypothetical protein